MQCRNKARHWSLILPAVERNAVNPLERERSNGLYERVFRHFGRHLWERAAGFATIALAGLWKIRLEVFGDRMQPKTIVTRYQATAVTRASAGGDGVPTAGRIEGQELPPAAAAISTAEFMTGGRFPA